MTVSATVERSSPVAATALIVAMVATAVIGIVGSHIATWIFVVAEGLVVIEAALASLRWPRAALVGVVLSPILDRYLVRGLLAPDVEILAHLLSEALLVAVGVALVAQAARHSSLPVQTPGTVSRPRPAVASGGLPAAPSDLRHRVPPAGLRYGRA